MLSSNGTALLAHVSTNLLFVCNCNDLPSPQPQVCLSPHHNNYDETVGTLRFAERAKTIKNKVKHHSHKQPYAPSHTNKHPQFTLLNKRRCPLGRCQRNRLAGHHAQNAQEAAAGARGAQGGCGTRIHVHMVTCLNRQYYRHTPILHSTNAARHAARKCPTARTDQVRRCRLDRLMLVPWMLRVRITVWTLEQQLF